MQKIRPPVRRANILIALAALLAQAACQSAGLGGKESAASTSAASAIAQTRSDNGLPPLTADPTLELAALQQAHYMAAAGAMEHTTGLGKDFSARMKDNGIGGPAAENIAEGRMDAGRLIGIWMDSPPHRRNMLDPRMNKFGLASVAVKDGKWRYWAMVLGK